MNRRTPTIDRLRRKFLNAMLAVGALTTVISPNAVAQTWKVQSGSAWSTNANWVGGTAPTNDGTAHLVFADRANNFRIHGRSTLDTSWDVATIQWTPESLESGENLISVPVNVTPALTLTVREGLTNASGGHVRLEPALHLPTSQTWNSTADLSVAENVTATGSLTVTGGGTVSLLGTTNTFADPVVVIQQSILRITEAGALTSPGVQLDSSTLRIDPVVNRGRNPETLTPQLTVTGTSSLLAHGVVTAAGGVTGPGHLTLGNSPGFGADGGAFVLTGTNDFSGGLTIDRTDVTISGAAQSLGTSDVRVTRGGTLELSTTTNLAPDRRIHLDASGGLILANETLDPAALVATDPADQTGRILLSGETYARSLDLAAIGNGRHRLGSTGTTTYTAPSLGAGADDTHRIGGNGTLIFRDHPNVFQGSTALEVGSIGTFGTVELHQANSHTGGTILRGGNLLIGHDQALGSGTIELQNGFFGSTEGSGLLTISNNVLISSAATSTLSFGSGAGLRFTGPVDLGGEVRKISGSFAKTTLAGDVSNGGLLISNGVWGIESAVTLNELTIGSGARLELDRSASLSIATGQIHLLAGTLLGTQSLTVSQTLRSADGGGTIAAAAGTRLRLTGGSVGYGLDVDTAGIVEFASGSYGGVRAQKGVLELSDGTYVEVLDLAPDAEIRGTGDIGHLSPSTRSVISPGTETPGTLTLRDFYIQESADFVFDLLGEFSDTIVITELFVASEKGVGSLRLTIRGLETVANGDQFTLFDWTDVSGSEITLSDFELPNGLGTLELDGQRLIFTAVPEPSVVALLAVAVAAVAGAVANRRRSRRPDQRKTRLAEKL